MLCCLSLSAFYVPASLLGGIIGLVLIQLVQLIPGGMAVLRQGVMIKRVVASLSLK